MFYQGDLRSGINTAIEQSKLVVCYVRSQGNLFVILRFGHELNNILEDGEETTTWEDDFLQEPEVSRYNQTILEEIGYWPNDR